MHIHHVDMNPLNNDISNLAMKTAQAHLSEHMTEERREKARKWAEVIRPLTKEWHASKE